MIDPFAVAQALVDFAIDAGKGKIGLVVLCGSYAKGTASASSDLDLYFVPDDAAARKAVSRSFVLGGLPYDLWGPGWPLLEAIANAESPNRPWAVSASLIADTQILWHRSKEDLDRFNGLKTRIDELCQPGSQKLMVEKALVEIPDTVFQLGQMKRAAILNDSKGLRVAGWKLVFRAANALALMNQTYFHKGWGANHKEILALEARPQGFEDLLSSILQPTSDEAILQSAERLSEAVRMLLVEAQAEVADPSPAADVFADVYPFVWEYRTKIQTACDRGDRIAAAAAAIQLQEEIASMMNKVAAGFYGARFNLPSEIVAEYEAAGLPDLVTAASTGDLPCLAERAKLLDSQIQTWLRAQGVAVDVLSTMEDLAALLGR